MCLGRTCTAGTSGEHEDDDEDDPQDHENGDDAVSLLIFAERAKFFSHGDLLSPGGGVRHAALPRRAIEMVLERNAIFATAADHASKVEEPRDDLSLLPVSVHLESSPEIRSGGVKEAFLAFLVDDFDGGADQLDLGLPQGFVLG